MNRFETIDDVWKYLDQIPMFQHSGDTAANYSLDSIRAFCEELADPQDQYPCIHVAGTNGKGTTCHMIERIYRDAGYKTGLYTSPHLIRYQERVRLLGVEITDEAMIRFFNTASELLETYRLSYFEISTALAFWYFAEQEVDVAIIETGLGGRLDATNIITPVLSVITSIGLDHQSILGDRIDQIAREKAGIIKKNVPVILGNITGEAAEVILDVAEERGSRVLKSEDRSPVWKKGRVYLENPKEQLTTSLPEEVNKWNFAMALMTAEVLQSRFSVKQEIIKHSLEHFSGIPARFERLHPDREWYFSGAHNAQALQSVLQTVQKMRSLDEVVLVCSVLKDKVNEEFLNSCKLFKKTYFVEQKGDRAAKFEDLRTLISAEQIREDRYEIILKELQSELVIFTGSFYFYPTVKRWIYQIS